MKLLKLLEMPYLHSGDYEPDRPRRMSESAKLRTTTLLFNSNGVEFRIMNEESCVYGFVYDASTKDNQIVFQLRFKDSPTITNFPPEISQDDVLQVDSVYMDRNYRNETLCATVYEHLVRAGYVLMSDESQFTPAVHLWHKLIRRNNFPVYVMDVDNGFVSKDGQPIRYDGKNIKFEDIWTSGEDLSGMYKILVMKQ